MVVTVALPALGFPSRSEEERNPVPVPRTAEEGWVQAASRGDKHAFAGLVEQHGRAVLGLCIRLLGSTEEGRDAAQETFARAYASLDRYDPARPFVAWLLRIARNHCVDLLRRRGADPLRLELDDAAEGAAPPEPEDPAAARGDLVVERRELSVALERAVAKLPPNQRAALVLFHVEQLPYREVAATLDVPVGTVMTWLHRARAKLRRALAPGTEVAR